LKATSPLLLSLVLCLERNDQGTHDLYLGLTAPHRFLRLGDESSGSSRGLLELAHLSVMQGSGFRVQGSGFRVQGSGFRVQGPGFRVQGSGFRVQGTGFRVQGSGFRVEGLEFRSLPVGCTSPSLPPFASSPQEPLPEIASFYSPQPSLRRAHFSARPHRGRDLPGIVSLHRAPLAPYRGHAGPPRSRGELPPGCFAGYGPRSSRLVDWVRILHLCTESCLRI
jgi:hypothetical protein